MAGRRAADRGRSPCSSADSRSVGCGTGPRCRLRRLRRRTRMRTCRPSSRYRRCTRLRLIGPAFTPQHDVDAQVAKPRPRHRQFADAHPQRRLILRLAASIPGRAPQQRQPTRPLHTDREALPNPAGQLAAAGRLQTFFAAPPAGCAGRASGRPPGASAGRSPPRACAACAARSRPAGRTSSSRRRRSPQRRPAAGRHRRPACRLGLAQRVGDLLLGEPRLLHARLLLPKRSQRRNLLYF